MSHNWKHLEIFASWSQQPRQMSLVPVSIFKYSSHSYTRSYKTTSVRVRFEMSGYEEKGVV